MAELRSFKPPPDQLSVLEEKIRVGIEDVEKALRVKEKMEHERNVSFFRKVRVARFRSKFTKVGISRLFPLYAFISDHTAQRMGRISAISSSTVQPSRMISTNGKQLQELWHELIRLMERKIEEQDECKSSKRPDHVLKLLTIVIHNCYLSDQ